MNSGGAADNKYTVRQADTEELYAELRTLWCEAFGDEPSYVDSFYAALGDSVRGYLAVDSEGHAASALTLYPCGTYGGRPVYVSYAVCTKKELRGQGIGAMLTARVRDEVATAGGISIVSPAEPGLESFYAALGYEPHFTASELAVMSPVFDDEDFEDYDVPGVYEADFGVDSGDGPPVPALDVKRIDAAAYNRYREALLSDRPHVELGGPMLSLLSAECEGFYLINRGDAIFAAGETGPFRTVLTEFILNPVLQELSLGIDEEITAMLAEHFGSAEVYYRTPGPGRCQSMAYGLVTEDGIDEEEMPGYGGEPYFGFPVD